LISLRKISVSTFFVFLHLAASGAFPYGIRTGAAEAGMGYACISREGIWSSFHNQALLAFNETPKFSAGYENRFGLKELGTTSASLLVPAGKTSAGAAFSHFGFSGFRREALALACGMRLGKALAAGIQTDYFSEKAYGEHEAQRYLTFEAGALVFPSENVRIGFHVFNPVPNSLRKKDMPLVISAGAGINLGKTLFACAEAELPSGKKPVLRTGFEYEPAEKLRLRAGYSTENNSFCFGTGFRLGSVTADLGFVSHETLGFSSCATVTVNFR
jgi:hypothetical protein